MNKRALQNYAVWAKNSLEEQIEVSLKTLGINSEKDIKEARIVGDYCIIDGDQKSYPKEFKQKRDSIINLIKSNGYEQVIEEFAYTWFNRIVALRFMEVHDFIPHGFRVLSSRDGSVEPEIMKHLNLVKDELKLDLSIVEPLYSQGKLDDAFRYVLFRQCKALSEILPMLFSSEEDYLELLLPNALLRGETFITKILEIDEEDFLNAVEVMGWLYQFYVADDRQEFRDAKVVTKDLIPTLTQVFTPDWIVRYMAENSVGRIWLESYPNSSIKNDMKYYVEDAKQEDDVKKKLDSIKYKNVNPEEIKIIEPCCGSGHILVYVFDLLYKMYEEKGYQQREIPTKVLENNLVGLEIDKRAAQLASFSLIMKARSKNSKFFNKEYYRNPKVFEIIDSRNLIAMNYRKKLENLKLLTNEQIKDLDWLVDTFKLAKTVGSLLIVDKKDFSSMRKSLSMIKEKAVLSIFETDLLSDGIKALFALIDQAEVMSSKYDVMITNPPYLNLSKLDKVTKEYLSFYYRDSKTDMFSMFMETHFVKANGFDAIVNPDSWMFLSSYTELRKELLNKESFYSMAQLGLGAFDATVQTVTFVKRRCIIDNHKATFFKIIKNDRQYSKDELFELINSGEDYRYYRTNEQLKNIPEYPIVYWLSDNVYSIFKNNKQLGNYLDVKNGMSTTDNTKYTRVWSEVDINKIKTDSKNAEDALKSKKKWFPYNKGGDYRKWYGNEILVANWENDGKEIKKAAEGATGGRIVSQEFYFLSSLSWSKISTGQFSLRYYDCGSLFDVAGPSIFGDYDKRLYILGALNSCVKKVLLESISPTLNYERGHICKFPVIEDKTKFNQVVSLVEENISLARIDWDSFENSWNFTKNCLVQKNSLISDLYKDWEKSCKNRFYKLKNNEEELNKIFIDIYSLEKELQYEIDDNDISIRLANKNRDVKNLISYLVGVELGRYSLDINGIAYAGGKWNDDNYISYLPDDDGIVPLYTDLGMEDSLTTRIIKLIKHIYGEDNYRDNIDFIAESLGKNNSESSEETLNRYLNYDFYNEHLMTFRTKTSGARPIYWMFSSGKNDAFKCLVYLHRYDKNTLAKINSKYFLNESARLNNEVNETRLLLDKVEGKEKLKLDKQMKTLLAKQKEMIEYGQVLDHMANKYIDIDLDDGVKVNYAKFQGIEVVNDNGIKIKKDLLIPIK